MRKLHLQMAAPNIGDCSPLSSNRKNLRQNLGDRAPPESPCVAAGTLALTAVQGAESLSHWASLTGVMGAGGFEETHRFHTDAPGISSLAFYIQSYRKILLEIYCLLKQSNVK